MIEREDKVFHTEHYFDGEVGNRSCVRCGESVDSSVNRQACPESTAARQNSHTFNESTLEVKSGLDRCSRCGISWNAAHEIRCEARLAQLSSGVHIISGGFITIDNDKLQTLTIEPKAVSIEVELMNGSKRWYKVEPNQGWKIDTTDRLLIINKGLGRIQIPLENISYFSPVEGS
jgi:ribosomal protein S27AE